MKWGIRLVLLAAIVTLGLWLWSVLFPPPEKVIRHRLDALARDVSFRGDENPLVLANKAGTVMEFFTTNIAVNVEIPGRGDQTFEGRDELMQAVAGAHAATGSLAIQFIDVEVQVAPDKRSALVSLVVRARAGGEKDDALQPLRFTFERSGRDWLIRRIETLRTLT